MGQVLEAASGRPFLDVVHCTREVATQTEGGALGDPPTAPPPTPVPVVLNLVIGKRPLEENGKEGEEGEEGKEGGEGEDGKERGEGEKGRGGCEGEEGEEPVAKRVKTAAAVANNDGANTAAAVGEEALEGARREKGTAIHELKDPFALGR